MSHPKVWLYAVAILGFFSFALPATADQMKHNQDMSNGDVMIMTAWVRAAPPTARVMAGYATLHNQSDRQQSLTGVSSPIFERVEIHESYVDGGVSKMREIAKLDIPAGEMVTLAPGGLHLMLIGPGAEVKHASQIEMTFSFASGDSKTVNVDVMSRGDAMPNMQHKNH